MEKQRLYYDKKFLGSMSGRPIRILSEYLFPLESFNKHQIDSTIVFFGSARIENKNNTPINKYYSKAKDLSYKITKWNLEKFDGKKFVVASGAGPGIMEAANQGAYEAKGKTVGLGISLPFEQTNNKWITKGLNFVFHYFFMRKFWFIYKTKGIVVWPGGVGTLDEFFDIITLIQTKKITRNIPIILFGKDFWDGLIDWDRLIENKVISKSDLDLFVIINSVEEAFEYLKQNMDI
ncbi:MAG: lysine decarboxylase [Candidatus Marinimicrobia bacterium]|nr:lysine decarboxylase [Candidatus Neomarinimicrobiota bacterium]|tara:strand:+ start:1278 stop:1982 length:705 start_codon:yes stop_codon:yes gene_type:complete